MSHDLNILSINAPAKINLYLHVTGIRDDGYHLLDSLVVFTTINDIVLIEPSNNLALINQGPFGKHLPTKSDNLVMRAAEQLQKLTGVVHGAKITLTKNLPIASGIGGGSADAAAVIRGLVHHWKIDASLHDLPNLALRLGADVPICLFGQPAFIGGIGEQINPVYALPKAPMVLVNPIVDVSTPTIFKACKPPFSLANQFVSMPTTLRDLVILLKDGRGNDLMEPAIKSEPIIGDVLQQIKMTQGCQLARMSGSGATCFGIYHTQPEADEAAKMIKNAHSQWWVVATSMISDVDLN